MTLPSSLNVRRFYQAALQRNEDAIYLLDNFRTTGAIYMAGYAIECILKAMILSLVPEKDQKGILETFRGAKAHDYDWLIIEYRRHGGISFPRLIFRQFARVNTWSTDLRYKPGRAKVQDAKEFLAATKEILEWADGRL